MVCALGGADNVSGEGEADKLIGGAGNDTMSGGTGADTLQGRAGNDTVDRRRGRRPVRRRARHRHRDRLQPGAGRHPRHHPVGGQAGVDGLEYPSAPSRATGSPGRSRTYVASPDSKSGGPCRQTNRGMLKVTAPRTAVRPPTACLAPHALAWFWRTSLTTGRKIHTMADEQSPAAPHNRARTGSGRAAPVRWPGASSAWGGTYRRRRSLRSRATRAASTSPNGSSTSTSVISGRAALHNIDSRPEARLVADALADGTVESELRTWLAGPARPPPNRHQGPARVLVCRRVARRCPG